MRSKYIYLIYGAQHWDCRLISVHTVKHEAHSWLEKSDWDTKTTSLYRMLDGTCLCDKGQKMLTPVEWDPELFDLDELEPLDRMGIQATSTMADWPEWAQGLL